MRVCSKPAARQSARAWCAVWQQADSRQQYTAERRLLLLLALVTLMGCSAVSRSAPAQISSDPALQPTDSVPTARVGQPTSRPESAISMTSDIAAAPTSPPPLPSVSPTALATSTLPTIAALPLYGYPIGIPGRPPGDGFYIRDGYAVENTWYNPGWWHTGEDWYATERSTVGARVYAVADGEVVYAGANYPGRVVIIRHDDGLFSMYGHLDPKLAVKTGQRVARGQAIGTVGPGWDRAPGHLHFEIRTFLTERAVNGAAPRYGYRCGVNCPPGPGYWPMDAPDHPSQLGWRNPTHTIARRAFAAVSDESPGEVVVTTPPISASVTLWSSPPGDAEPPRAVAELALRPGERLVLLEIRAGAEDSRATSAQGYQLWYRIRLPNGTAGWAQAAVPSARETGSDGRAASVFFNFVPALPAPA